MEKTLNLGRLRRFRKEAGFSQAKMAQLLGYESQSGYANIENGRVALKADQAVKIAAVLRRGVEELYDSEPIRTVRYMSKEFHLIGDCSVNGMKGGHVQFANTSSGILRILQFEWYPNGDVERQCISFGPLTWDKIKDLYE